MSDPIEDSRLQLQELVAGGRTGQPMRLDRRRRRTPRKIRKSLIRIRDALRLGWKDELRRRSR